jgi:LmbE family N-acetylglucosaminyl deacetylase
MSSPRLLVVVAHPDDETFGCGSLLLHAATQGWELSVCCATRGEAGEPRPGSGITQDQLPAARERELRDAARLLGVEQVTLLGYRDSGMAGEPEVGALVAVPLEEVAARVQAEIERFEPQVVVTLDGSDGHRDHAHVRDATIRAAECASWEVEGLYLQCLSRSLLRRWADHRRTIDPDSPYLDVEEAALGTPDERITTSIDTSRFLEQRWQAIALHASQRSPYDDLPDDLADAFLTAEHLVQLRPPIPEGDLIPDPFANPDA